MRFWREMAGDGLSGGVLAVLLILAFVAQMALAGRAAAAMAAPDPLSVLCTSSPDGVDRPADPNHRQECPCSRLCGAGLHLQTGFAPSESEGIPIRFADRGQLAIDRFDAFAARPAVRQHRARGPPASSI